MLLIIAQYNFEVQRFFFPVSHPDDLPTVCALANRQLKENEWTILYRMFPFVDNGKAVIYDVDENGKWGEA